MLCIHKWVIIKEHTLDPIINRIKTIKGHLPPYFFHETYICILQCEKCGKLNKTIVSNDGES